MSQGPRRRGRGLVSCWMGGGRTVKGREWRGVRVTHADF